MEASSTGLSNLNAGKLFYLDEYQTADGLGERAGNDAGALIRLDKLYTSGVAVNKAMTVG